MQNQKLHAVVLVLFVLLFSSCAGKKPKGGGGGGGGGGMRPNLGAGEARPDGKEIGNINSPAAGLEDADGLQGQGLIGQSDPLGFSTPNPGVGIVPSGVSPFSDLSAPISSQDGSDAPPTLDSQNQNVEPPGSRLNSMSDPNPQNKNVPATDPTAVQTVRLDRASRSISTTHKN